MEEADIKTEFEYRKDPIVLEPGEVCKYVNICPYKQPNCYGTNKEREWDFVCDINKLRNIFGE